MDCPENSVYYNEMPLDVATCENPLSDYEVSLGTGEGCDCLEGFIAHGPDCVPVSDCGCVLPLETPIYLPVSKSAIYRSI